MNEEIECEALKYQIAMYADSFDIEQLRSLNNSAKRINNKKPKNKIGFM